MADVFGILGLSQSGKPDKLTIYSWDKINRDKLESAQNVYKAFINPEEISLNYNVAQDNQPALGSIGAVGTFLGVLPIELTVRIYLDGTGIAGEKIKVDEEINKFYKCVGYAKGAHRTNYLRIHWGKLSLLRSDPDLLECCLKSASVQYKLFKPDGTPLRAIINATFIEVVDYEKLANDARSESADLTHIRTVKEGDTLPALAQKIYGDFKYYLEVAKANNLKDFRNLEPGTQLIFPPFNKNVKQNTNA